MTESMSKLNINYSPKVKGIYISISLLFPNEYASKMWAEQWCYHYFNRHGEWELGMYNLSYEFPEKYISGLSIAVHDIAIYNHKLHDITNDEFNPSKDEVDNGQSKRTR